MTIGSSYLVTATRAFKLVCSVYGRHTIKKLGTVRWKHGDSLRGAVARVAREIRAAERWRESQ